VLSGFWAARQVTPVTREWRWLEREARTLPREIAVTDLGLEDPAPSYRLPRGPFLRAGVDVKLVPRGAPTPRPLYFVEGVACRAFSLVELAAPNVPDDAAALDWLLHDELPALVRHETPPGVKAVPAARDGCAPGANAEPVGAGETVEAPEDEYPFVAYAPGPLQLRLLRVR
jgi:hypothetical protein